MTKFVNPMNGYTEEVTGMSGVWAFVFGVFYFMYKGVWRHVLIQMLAGLVLVSLFGAAATVLLIPLWLGYAVFAKSIVEASYGSSRSAEGGKACSLARYLRYRMASCWPALDIDLSSSTAWRTMIGS